MAKPALINIRVLTAVVAGALLTVGYTNCGQFITNAKSMVSLSSSSSGICDVQLYHVFSGSYRPFLQKNCSSCHNAKSTAAPGDFGDPNSTTAFASFFEYGTDATRLEKIKNNAVDENHPNPLSGPGLASALQIAESGWQMGLDRYYECTQSDDTLPGQGAQSAEIALFPGFNRQDSAETERTFDFNALAETVPAAAGASVRFEIQLVYEARMPSHYILSRPRLKAGATPLHVKNMRIYFNGKLYAAGTTYRSIDVQVPANSERDLLPVGAAGMIGRPDIMKPSTDTMSVEFEVLEGR